MTEPITQFAGKHAFLSNFYPCPVEYGDETYPTVEHAYQAAKTTDRAKRSWIGAATTPGLAKQRGRRAITLRADWEQVKEATMWYLLSQKFGLHHPDLRVRLHQTGDAKLVEGNNWGDTYWGVCEGVGQNRLGVLLMALRWTNQHWHFQELEQLMIRPLDKYP